MPLDERFGRLFHLAIPCRELEQTLAFYVEGLGCAPGRRTEGWAIVDFFGQQVVLHLAPEAVDADPSMYPRHFGMVFEDEAAYEAVLARARAHGAEFFAEPFRRYEGTREEHGSFFLRDPSHNLVEFKHYRHPEAILG